VDIVIDNIAVLGAGTMGYGIALNFAMYGISVNLYETNESVRDSVMARIRASLEFFAEENVINEKDIVPVMERIFIFSDLKEAVRDVDYVIEATFEDIKLKRELFKQLDEYCQSDAILASNTSSLALNEMVQDISDGRKKKCMVCHWYNPPHIMPLAELSFFGNMSTEDFEKVYALYERINKVPIKVLKDIPGLIANRIQQGVAREVFSLMQMEAASAADIDKAIKFGPAFRYATAGQLEIADMGGIDIWCAVGDNLLKVMDNSQQANDLLREKVKAGKLGMKSGEGFFKYSEEEKEKAQRAFNKRLINQLKACEAYK